jgi:hypothetical protein
MRFYWMAAAVCIAASAQAEPFPAQSGSSSTTPHYLQRTIVINPGMSSGAIKIPAANVPVHMMVAVPTFGIRGIAEVTIMRVGPDNPFLAWVGLDAFSNAISAADGPAAKGTHIVYVTDGTTIDVQQDTSEAIRIQNGTSRAATVVVTFTW